ncbi:DUF2238 domain-containing protein [Actibacterium sp. XHP0104]|uniref:DUF2238 domain-containing protein n=1 Tax=Actibacterium sp. XHP0104 TaxID=2984335 RepID=UPI0021E7D53D|nr:DUF2238 domain-containing protein [Actibacterium sp. XHP0104]MCV2882198.1 DUF2238 domain-containing protein [Actibacterium sp. XHP0104]
MRIKKSEWAVCWFTLAYVGAFGAWFLSIGNYEFIWYIATMVGLILLVGINLRKAEFPVALLWALTLWGLAHMAGGGVKVGDSVLYSAMVIPFSVNGELSILKYDQIVHAYGFGTTAWLLWHLLTRHYPDTRGTWTAAVYPAFGAMGLGAVNEIIEFIAVLGIADTNVGGYYNTALDLVFNATGAIIAVVILSLRGRR